jgi:hypothetical protein
MGWRDSIAQDRVRLWALELWRSLLNCKIVIGDSVLVFAADYFYRFHLHPPMLQKDITTFLL